MPALPDDALVVRGGINTVELLVIGSGVTVDAAGNLHGISVNLHGISVNCAPRRTVAELSVGMPNRQIGVTSVGTVRAAGGEVTPDPTFHNPYHCLLKGIPADAVQALFNPPILILNPSRVK